MGLNSQEAQSKIRGGSKKGHMRGRWTVGEMEVSVRMKIKGEKS